MFLCIFNNYYSSVKSLIFSKKFEISIIVCFSKPHFEASGGRTQVPSLSLHLAQRHDLVQPAALERHESCMYTQL